MKIKNILLVATLTISITSISQVALPPDSSFYYNPNGTKNWFYLQKDVLLYRMNSGACFTMSPNSIIDNCQHLFSTFRKFNRIKFSAASSQIQRAMVINSIYTNTNFESFTPAVSKTKNATYLTADFKETNGLILVQFDPIAISSPTAVNAFANRNNLTLIHQPNSALPNATSWTHIFKINRDPKGIPNSDVFGVCQYIFTNEVGVIKNCEPDFIEYTPGACEIVQEFSNASNSGLPDGLWHIRNRGLVAYNTFVGLNGADAEICECWGEGFHGENVKVAVIDQFGYDYTHPEMSGQFLNGYDFVNNVPFSTTKYVSNSSHGMEVASVISAKANNNNTFNTVGVAYNSKILPYIYDGSSGTAIQAIQQAVLDGADIINMSFSSSSASSNLQSPLFNDIALAKSNGRGGLGCFVVASSGNSNVDGKFYPAADFNVFGVGATTASDGRAVVPTWGWSGGSNYYTPLATETSPRYNVVAPGTRIFAAFTQAPLSSPSQIQAQLNGTSFSAPIVAGIGAILLSKNSSLTVSQIEAAIQNGTDKVLTAGNYTTYPNLLGYNPELFYGRVNCFKALSSVPVGIRENNKNNLKIDFIKLSENEVGIYFNSEQFLNGYNLKVFDIGGKTINSINIDPNSKSYILNTSTLLQGMYIINVTDNNNTAQYFKFIK
ncbi:MAG: S8 family serine peptidase [Bacteroidota bacterium]